MSRPGRTPTCFRYLVSPNSAEYRAIMGLFAHTLLTDLSPAEVAAGVAEHGIALTEDEALTRLRALERWGNLVRGVRDARVATIRDFHRGRSRFHATVRGGQVHRDAETVLTTGEGTGERSNARVVDHSVENGSGGRSVRLGSSVTVVGRVQERRTDVGLAATGHRDVESSPAWCSHTTMRAVDRTPGLLGSWAPGRSRHSQGLGAFGRAVQPVTANRLLRHSDQGYGMLVEPSSGIRDCRDRPPQVKLVRNLDQASGFEIHGYGAR